MRSHNPNLKPLVASDIPDSALPRKDYDETQSSDPETVIYRINGALFFGATASIGTVLDRISDSYKTFVIDFEDVSFLDSTGANMIEGLVQKANRRGIEVWLTGTSRATRRLLLQHGLRRPLCRYASSIADALQRKRMVLSRR